MFPKNNGHFESLSCQACRDGRQLDFKLRMAFQPIFDLSQKTMFAYEALARGPEGQGAGWVLEQVTKEHLYQFDQVARVTAIETAAKLKMETKLSINFLPNAVYKPETCIRATLEAAETFQFPTENLIFEVSEGEEPISIAHLVGILKEYRSQGFLSAIDDFGAGYSGLKLLTRLTPDIVKFDRDLISDIHLNPKKQKIMRHMISLARDLNILSVAEGIELPEERDWLLEAGIALQQGYLFARPALEKLETVETIISNMQ
ncbi:MAG: EAL domain-containing protein [Leptospiraceae bacterium]|nr:EAL domain-containing protein [Leptospiraceae bacterium]